MAITYTYGHILLYQDKINKAFLVKLTDQQPVVKLKWKTDKPVWVDQWPLTTKKVASLQQLVQEQLQAGHIQPSVTPWNTPVFVISKNSGKWRLLHDLRRINEVMEDMGPLQPELPSPAVMPREWSRDHHEKVSRTMDHPNKVKLRGVFCKSNRARFIVFVISHTRRSI